jgi:transcriptional regulator
MGSDRPAGELLQGTLDMMILRTLDRGPNHGWGIAQHIQRVSEEVLRVEEGSLYPALHRLEVAGEVAAEWGLSENNRRARIYRLTARGRRRLAAERERWGSLVAAIARVLETA